MKLKIQCVPQESEELHLNNLENKETSKRDFPFKKLFIFTILTQTKFPIAAIQTAQTEAVRKISRIGIFF